ncbi:hypothetical protein BCS96_10840 [Vibrio breoganii]|nr:hypothetical protein BCU81_11460 [Vibrio breoganii]PML27199.1 hypothetical protein BCT82_02160 [Vibrio breoganii]PML36708.1 hypothetical protein BCT78_09495 [Vibrio breoganii]PMO98962.1 hypothetical protein BCS96_10840 [Vibrio breoganii]TKG26893.1 hypothetical protein FCV87_12500 [Vibrio breoganii]
MKRVGILFLLLIQFSLSANEWTFPVPMYRGQTFITEVNIVTDGERLIGVNSRELHERIKKYLSPVVSERLLSFDNRIVNQEELNRIGINLDFDKLDLSLNLSLSRDDARQNQFSFDVPYEKPLYSEAGLFSWHNIFNLTTNYIDSELDTSQLDWRVEWISNGNIGGYQGLNLESSVYAVPDELNLDESMKIYRGDIRAFVDRPEYPLRFTIGDITPYSAGHLPSTTLGGISMERLWNRLQPTRNIKSGGSQDIYLVESATVGVYINGTFYGDIRLPPGRYSIDDLPLRQGDNDILLSIRYQSGRREEITYSQFFNTRLLKKGFSDYGIYAGVISEVVEREYSYDTDQTVGQLYYDYGLTDSLTIGLNGLYHNLGQIAGFSLGIGTGDSNIGFRGSILSYSESQESDSFGYIASIDFSTILWGNLNSSSANFRSSFESFYDYRSTPWQTEDDIESGNRGLVSYTYRLYNNVNLNTYVQVDTFQDPVRYDITGQLELEINYFGFDVTLGIEHQQNYDLVTSDETTYYAIIGWDWYSDDGNYEFLAQYFTRENVTRATFNKYSSNTVGSYGYQLNAERSDILQSYEARANYVGNRYSAEIDVSRFDDNEGVFTANSVSGRLSTGFTMVDSDISWNRGYRGPTAIVSVHDSLEVPVHINEFIGDSPEAIATSTLSNSAPLYSGHSSSSFDVSIPDAPIGYDYGSGYYQITPGTYTGHVVHVGSDEAKTVIGSLVDINGKPIGLRNGIVSGEGVTRSIFTNKAGRFAIDRMKSGTFKVTIIGKLQYTGILVIDDVDKNLIYLNPVALKEVLP